MATTPQLTRTETVSLAALSAACGTILANTFRGEGEPLIASLALSGMAYAAAYAMIRWLGPTFIKAGLKGVDMSKTNRREIPECAGAICAVVYLLAIIVFTPFPFYKDIVAATSGGGNRDVVLHAEHVHEGRFLHKFPHSKVSMPPTFLFPRMNSSGTDRAPSNSSPPSSPRYSLFRPSPSSESATTSSTSAGGTSSSSPPSPRSPS
jgi:hypothetical protein